MSTRTIVDSRNPDAPAKPPTPPVASRWPTVTAIARSQRELVQLSLRLCPGADEAQAR